MPMILIEGEYRIVNAAPDGDSIRFYPNRPEAFALVAGTPVRTNRDGGAQLRLDGIDALETHYNPAGPHLGNIHQPHDLGDRAAQRLLAFLGFSDVARDGRQTVTAAAPAAVRGYVLTRFADAYGRVIAFAFKGNRAGKTGDSVRLEVEELKRSWNCTALAEGHAYPTFYSKLYVDLRKAMARASRDAREAKRGIWRKDVSYRGFTLDALQDLFDQAYVMPKLWRRIASYVEFNDGQIALDKFARWLAQDDDRLVVLPDGQSTGFDNVVSVDGQTVRLTEELENLIFQEK